MKIKLYVLFGLVLALAGVPAFAQSVSTAKVSGTVTDATGGILVGADVTAKANDTGLTRVVKTGGAGSYSTPSLPIGSYTVQAAAAGFGTQIRNGITLQVDTSPTINFKLAPGSVTQ